MQVHISHKMNRITIFTANGRYFSYRTLFYSVLLLAFLLPFIFIRTALVTLENFSKCSTTNCLGRKWAQTFPPFDFNQQKDSKRILALLSKTTESSIPEGMTVPGSIDDLILEIKSKNLDSKTSLFEAQGNGLLQHLQSVLYEFKKVEVLDHQAKEASLKADLYKRFASTDVPKGLHCLSLKLTMEYTSNARARCELPSPELVPHLIDNSLHHYIVATDNILAASVVVSSTVKNSKEPWKIVFHVVTDRKTYAAMHAWFALFPVPPAIVEVKGVHQFAWLTKDYVPVVEAVETHDSVLMYHQGNDITTTNLTITSKSLSSKLQTQNHKYISILNHLRIYLPQLFPELRKVIFLDYDVVVQRDLSPLWDIDLGGKVNGAVEACSGDYPWIIAKRFKHYFNFSNPVISERFDPEKCAWAYGLNIFDLEAWRKSPITQIYHYWLKQNIESNLSMWRIGTQSPSLIAFDGYVHPIDSSWHMLGLGYHRDIDIEDAKSAAVIHYNGLAKPWLGIAFPELKLLWMKYIDFSNEFIQHCNIIQS